MLSPAAPVVADTCPGQQRVVEAAYRSSQRRRNPGLLGQSFSDIAELWLGADVDGGGGVTSAGGDCGTATGEKSGLQFLGEGSGCVCVCVESWG